MVAPLTAKDYVVKMVQLPLKFQLLGFADGNVVEDIQDILLQLREGLEQTWELAAVETFDSTKVSSLYTIFIQDYDS